MIRPSVLRLLLCSALASIHFLGYNHDFTETFWHFGETSKGLYFDTAGNPPVVTNNSFTPYTNEGCSVLNHPNTGDLVFYTDGIKVVDATHTIMPNGSGLIGHTSCYGSGKLATDPGDCNRYYIFHGNTAIEDNPNGDIHYSVVDITLPGMERGWIRWVMWSLVKKISL